MVRTRFAPSPTGYLHIGGLRTALYAYLFAKKEEDGKFLLRIEDTDLERYVEGATELIYFTLRDAGLMYDEGPDVGGAYGPYIQSERKELYIKCAHELVKRGGAYYCFCSKERLEEIKAKGATKYDRHCDLNIPVEEAMKRIANGEKYVVRQKIPGGKGSSAYKDMVFGTISVDYDDMEDGVLLKSDGMPTYNFANVVDDHMMGITHVIRGTEYLSSTPKYNLIYESFGWEKPQYIHLQPIMKNEREKLSKRHGAASYDDFLKKGFIKEAIINYIALLGWSPKEDREKFSMDELKERFSLAGISKSASIFDEVKMRWLNSLYIKEMSAEAFHETAKGWYTRLEYLKETNQAYLSELMQPRIEIFSDIKEKTAFINEFDGYDLALLEHQKMKTDRQLALSILPDIISTVEKGNFAELHDDLNALITKLGLKNGQVYWIFRIAVTGSAVTPGGATEMAKLLGKAVTLARLKETLRRLSQ